jgi:short subunit dehydrogenase-like uncharacterized protein
LIETAGDRFLLYGSYGYTGRLIAREAMMQGLTPILSGRDEAKLRSQASALGLEWRVAPLDDHKALDTAVAGAGAVLHCAGPFHATVKPMIEACLRGGVHYLDVTGEIGVFATLAALDGRAREAGIMVLPGCGFDVVPTDCVAARLAEAVPGARGLTLAIQGSGPVSRGTACTMIGHLGYGGAIRREGALTRVPTAWRTRRIDFGRGPVLAVTIPWGDVFTAYRTTGIPDIEVYAAISSRGLRVLQALRRIERIVRTAPVKRGLQWIVRRGPSGPSQDQLERGENRVWGEIVAESGKSKTLALRTPQGYRLTAMAAIAIMEKVVRGDYVPGFQTPARAYGPGIIDHLPGVEWIDVDER